ncbi:hypothetical protein [Bifidobacterium moukalabense]|uniref:hypothetical protein n=1 Tax=Bifidobacterium moukalabense TaxID=1333651 RepID=UPI00148552A4|nr:hypothetical protein [Bifidobacterium moukalabense]
MMDVSAAYALMLSAWLTGNAKAKTMQMTLSRTVKNDGNRLDDVMFRRAGVVA